MCTLIHPLANVQAFWELAATLRRYRALALEMARRELTEQYAGQAFGRLWVLIHPLVFIGLYVFVFAVVLKTKVGGTAEQPLDYTVYMLSGLIPWMVFQQSMSRACSALTSQANLVKQVVFPIEVLPAKTVIASLVPLFIGFMVFLGYVFWTFSFPHPTYLLLPGLIFLQLLAMMGVAFGLSAIGAYLRDTKDFVQLFGVLGIYVMPIVYLPDWVPSIFQPVIYLNPFSYMVWCYQDTLYFGNFRHPWAWAIFVVGSLFAFTAGYRVFRSLRPQLGNVL